MTNFTPEMIEKARAAKTAEELLALAKENNVEMTEEEAKTYFAQFNPVSGELSDDELDNVAGGGCHASDGRLITTIGNKCKSWMCPHHTDQNLARREDSNGNHLCNNDKSVDPCCNNCRYCSYESGIWYCNCSSNRK